MFKFYPILKERIWGGNTILKYKHITSEKNNIGEVWDLSALSNNESKVQGGKYNGFTLSKLTKTLGDKLLGQKNMSCFKNQFPLLIKFLDAQADLSIQVHPQNKIAQKRHQSSGKNETWYILSAKKDAKICLGFSKKIDINEYEKRVKENSLQEVLNYQQVKEGEIYNIPAGLVHSLGKGITAVEIQQTSDITYRIFDYNRKDKNGNTRTLHTELAKDVIICKPTYEIPNIKIKYELSENQECSLVTSEYYNISLYHITKNTSFSYSNTDSFIIFICIKGLAKITDNNQDTIIIRTGETLLIPATTQQIDIDPLEETKILKCWI